MKRLLKTVIIIAIILLSIAYIKGQIKRDASSAPETVSGPVSKEGLLNLKQEIFSFKVEGFGKDKTVEWALEGDSANVVDEKIYIKNMRGKHYGKDMILNLRSDEAVYDKKNQDVELMGNITGRTSDGGELYTDYAKWNAASEEITNDSHVIIKRKNITCTGEGVLTKPKLKWALLKTDVIVDFGSGKRITCDGPLELDLEKNVAIFNNNVKIIDAESHMLTDKLTAFLNPETNEVDNVVTEGNVQIIHKGDLEKLGKIGDMDVVGL